MLRLEITKRSDACCVENMRKWEIGKKVNLKFSMAEKNAEAIQVVLSFLGMIFHENLWKILQDL